MALSDTFTGSVANLNTHTSNSGHSWTQLNGSAGSGHTTDRIINLSGSGTIYSALAGVVAIYQSSWVPAAINIDISFTIGQATAAGYAGVAFNINLSDIETGSYYYLRFNGPSTQKFEFAKIVNNSGSLVTTFPAGTAAPSDTIAVEVRRVGSDNEITVIVNGTPETTIVDSSSPLAAGGVGVWMFSPDGSSAANEQLGSIDAADVGGGASDFTITGPSRGPQSALLANFTVTPNGTTTATWTPDAAAGCTYTPATLTLDDTNPQTFQVTKTSLGTVQINGTASGLTPPADVDYEAVATTTGNFAYQDGLPSTATTYQVMNDDNTGFQNEASAGTSSSLGSGGVSGVTIPADYEGRIEFRQAGGLVAAEVLTPPTGGGASGARIFTGM